SLQLQAKLDRLKPFEGVELRLRVAIGAGRSWAALVGGGKGWRGAVLQGRGAKQLATALEMARPGEVVLSETACDLAGSAILGALRGTHFVLTGVQGAGMTPNATRERRPAASEDLIRSLVPPTVIARLDAGQHLWLAEFRSATVGFIQVGGIRPDDCFTLQRTTEVVQSVVASFEGEVNHLVAEETGMSFVIVFGLAQHAHEDDATRAVRTSLTIRDQLREIEVDARLGLATG